MLSEAALAEDWERPEDAETWWFLVIDIVQILTQPTDYQTARKYWNKLKRYH